MLNTKASPIQCLPFSAGALSPSVFQMATGIPPPRWVPFDPDRIMSCYTDKKSIICKGSYGVLFATNGNTSRLAVKVAPCRWNWQDQLARLDNEILPLALGAENGWKNVVSGNRLFVHEKLQDDIKSLITEASSDESPLASAERFFWAHLSEYLSECKHRWSNCLVIEMPLADHSLRMQLSSWSKRYNTR